MNFRKRLTAVLLLICLTAAAVFLGNRGLTAAGTETENTAARTDAHALFGARDTLYFWYTDETLTDFINSAALEYYEKTGYRVVPRLESGLEYLEYINQASLHEKEYPDLFIATNDTLEKAYLAGLSSEITGTDAAGDGAFCQTARDAVTYHGKMVGYPFYYETSVLLYNKTYLMDTAKAAIEAEADARAGEEATALLENADVNDLAEADMTQAGEDGEGAETEDVLSAQAGERMQELIPATMEDILAFSDAYDAPENVEAILKWDVSDIFYNYFFVGNYMKTGGDTGDDPEQIDLNNEQVKECLQMYQELNQFFSIDAKEVSYDSILQEFAEGKIIFTVATTDAVARLEEAKKQGDFPYEYGVAVLPDINDTLHTRSLSVTEAVVVNGYSEKKEIANDFARFLTGEKAAELYEMTGKMAAREGISYENENVANCMDEYRMSVSMPKMIETSSFWVQLEIGFTKIWTGEDIQSVLDDLNEKMKAQLGGE